ncbi:SatD family protein [Lutibacter sp.]|uniref:SatD family protein n=1 Tax=Lutibacter sp. TaxID=1925666 RepID=UPI0025B866A7|nr:SatD family protein [Lutibacter sp.]MCF6182470.1 SatD family protein [Lutibacter sp.]
MIAIITGDVINSREVDAQQWMPELKKVLNKYGSKPKTWEIYRGDSFQIEITPAEALKAAILIKSTIKQFKSLDVRIAIGIGEKTYKSEKITESNGSAFIYSGQSFEKLKKQTLAIQTVWKEFDKTMNLMFSLATLTMDNWTPTSSLIIKTAIAFEHKINQKKLALLLNKKQSNISTSLKRGGFYEIQKLLFYYQQEIKNKC